ncbi:HIT family protein [Streptococcus cuniculi]|uniref:HIT family protein n=1 Tax=Streptococcus cuniculi TaxID=1432788 RepID=A0A4Y9J7Q4_9STRE|nr:HIT family protein [Streptococcus cuniculi]MBF0779001.1 HIT family protein [Streptococcus cuniculi]TFU97050.1 HIT family protein [Streptococcus cuniculi]
MHCIFCHDILEKQIIYQAEHFKLVWDIDPIQTGHLLIISKRHFTSLAELPLPSLHELAELEQKVIRMMEETLPIDGVTLVRNDKELMDRGTHFHSHLIPRTKDDGFWDSIDLKPLAYSRHTLEQSLRSL